VGREAPFRSLTAYKQKLVHDGLKQTNAEQVVARLQVPCEHLLQAPMTGLPTRRITSGTRPLDAQSPMRVRRSIEITVEIECRADQCEVRQCLRKIPQSTALRTDLLGVQARMIGVAQHLFEQ
jgi:hypothetical protein